MHILFVMHTTRRTGGHRTVFEYCNGLRKLGHRVSIVSLGFPRDHSWFSLDADVTYSRFGRLLNFYNFAALSGERYPRWDETHELTRIIPDCDLAIATYCQTATAAWRSPLPRQRAYFAQHFEPYFFSDEYRKRWALETYFLPIAKAANSIWLRDRIFELTGEEPPVINPGIDVSVFHPRQESQPSSRKTILSFVKPFVPWKGFNDLIQALRIVREHRDDFELVTFGAWKPGAEPKGIPFRHVLRPSDDELASLYSAADVVVSPSWYESFPLPPLEAMACGAPVVTTKPGTEDYAIPFENALVVPPRDPPALAEAITRLLDDESLRMRLSKEAAMTAARFTWTRAVGQMDEFVRHLAETAAVRPG